MVSSLRAAHLSSRSFRKGCSYSTFFRLIYPRTQDSPANAFLNASTSTEYNKALQSSQNEDSSTSEFWSTPRLQPRLNQPSSPSVNLSDTRHLDSLPDQADNHTQQPALPDLAQELLDKSRQPQLPQSNTSSPVSRTGKPKRSSYYEPSPSEFLIDTLQNLVLSSNDPDARNWTCSGQSFKEPIMDPLSMKQRFKFKRSHRVSLQEIIADYIQYVDPVLQKWGETAIFKRPRAASELEYALQSMLRDDYIKYLSSRQYELTDVMAWAWVLKSHTAYEAILRVFLLEAKNPKPQRVPPFITLMLLRQKLDLKTFRLLLIYSLHLISGQPVSKLGASLDGVVDDMTLNNPKETCNQEKAKISVNPNMCATYIVRLLHHSRQLWPEAQLSIAKAFAFYLNTLEAQRSSSTTDRVDQLMAQKCNTCLKLLSLPCKTTPFLSVSIQQQAQFELLKAMAQHHPVLPVTRRGYQGLIAIQIAHKKTVEERQSAELKASSWPPWKEDKLGIDSQRGVDGMKSRAMRVMSQMREAGYPHSRWEEVSGILAGWDTDHSPTIQTRTLVRRPETLRGTSGDANHHAIWEARLRSTRTVREAWACFSAYEAHGTPPRSTIYAAMAEKLIFRQKAIKAQADHTSLALAGDGLEVSPEPASARDWIYTPTEPPTLDGLVKKMLSQGLKPGGRFLALLLENAPSLRVGLDYLNCSNLATEQVRALCSVFSTSDSDVEHQNALDDVPDYLFSAFIHFLCKFAVVRQASMSQSGVNTADLFPIITGTWSRIQPSTTVSSLYIGKSLTWRKPRDPRFLSYAIQLLQKRNPQEPHGWIQLLSALRRRRVLGSSPEAIDRNIQVILAWHEILETMKWLKEGNIEVGFEGFHIYCSSFSGAVTAGVKNPNAVEEGLNIVDKAVHEKLLHFDFASPEFEGMVQTGLSVLKNQFDRLVLLDPKTDSLFEPIKTSLEDGTDSQVILPTLARVPSPAVLHAFVRSLGLAEDSDGLLSLLRWMSQHALILKEASDEYLNGSRMMRRTVVATRLFLEGYWGKEYQEPSGYEHGFPSQVTLDDSNPTFSDPALQEAYAIVTSTEVWGPWPSDEEVWEYVTHGSQ
ncbi:hypothetical protein P175DRAFT_0500307 [Aspergillus ochraceoroseus IBT 24754]|uniref:Uncharacterized protein n=1 Tax=Aspergillus ochraceoroseus IBT 24754 TaxID=1392256 RepID=A0A2T5LYP9_9EURO|nr:uncharacterized protein P175DRAFT_0500307 [Aspergillus ochraceoroseus IBT 24754]PTU21406.1 hypothetical protein P175DRAFT_0500307 [Aspergillus ochraceoroseus IBT 24754]